MDYGILSIAPIVIVFAVALSTKRTLLALFSGSVGGALILGKTGIFGTWFDYFYQSFADPDAEWLIMVTCLFGVLVALFESSGAIDDFAIWVRRFVNSKRKALLLTYLLGFVIFLDDYLNNLVVGTAMKPMTDKYGIPRSQLAYVVNSTAAPICVLIPISSWAVFFGTLLEGEGVTYNGTGIGAYIHSLPLVFYGWIALIVVLLVVLGVLPPIGPMKKHAKMAEETGRVFPPGEVYDELSEAAIERAKFEVDTDKKVNPILFLLPILIMIVVTIAAGVDIIIGTTSAIGTMFVLLLITRRMKVFAIFEAIYEGIVSMAFVAILVILAYMLQKMNGDLGLAEYVISVVEPLMKGAFLPAVVFIFCAVYAYCTGCFWDLAAIITPLVIPLAIAMEVDPMLAGAAIFSGAAFGSNTCMYGDAMILVSKSTDMQPVDNMLATLPYAAVSGGLTVIAYIVTGFIMC
ncbi:MAG: Na+/H+ antiporter NhaC family protein [Bacillota bacterium]|nr:Na+/H+ antiporter NhaC family protein [Bacillota bacterium]